MQIYKFYIVCWADFQVKILTFVESQTHIGLTLTTTQLQATTFLALPSLSILQRPAHSPSFLLSSTCRREENVEFMIRIFIQIDTWTGVHHTLFDIVYSMQQDGINQHTLSV